MILNEFECKWCLVTDVSFQLESTTVATNRYPMREGNLGGLELKGSVQMLASKQLKVFVCQFDFKLKQPFNKVRSNGMQTVGLLPYLLIIKCTDLCRRFPRATLPTNGHGVRVENFSTQPSFQLGATLDSTRIFIFKTI